jgi:predicted MFS family arabinose efflux permease
MSHSTSASKPDTPITSGPVEPPRTGPGNFSELPPTKNRLAAALRNKAMRAPLFWSVVGRFPLYLVTLALVVFTTSRGSSYRSAGLLLACYSLGIAVFAPFVARRVDMYGQLPLLLITGVVYPLALIGFVSADSRSLATQLACVIIAGATNPPISGCIRSLWSAPEGMERVGFSLEAVLSEVFVIGGPLLLSIVLFWASPGAALILGGMLASAGAIGLATTQASRTWRATAGERNPLGALRSAGLVRLLIVLICAAVSMGVFNIALPAFAHDHGSADSVGLIFGAWGVGGVLGGLWYGSRTLSWPAELIFPVGLLIISAGAALPLLAWDNWSMGVVLTFLGVVIAPITAVSYELVARTARSDNVTEAFTWAITVNIAGAAAGAQLGGLLISTYGTWAAFLGAVAALLMATAVAFAVRHRFANLAETSQPSAPSSRT